MGLVAAIFIAGFIAGAVVGVVITCAVIMNRDVQFEPTENGPFGR